MMKKVNVVVLPFKDGEQVKRMVRIENGDTGEYILDFVGFEDERDQLLKALEIVKENNGHSHFALQDLGFWLSLSFINIDNKQYVSGTILKHHHVMTTHQHYVSKERGAIGKLQAFRVYSLEKEEHEGTGMAELNVVFEGSEA